MKLYKILFCILMFTGMLKANTPTFLEDQEHSPEDYAAYNTEYEGGGTYWNKPSKVRPSPYNICKFPEATRNIVFMRMLKGVLRGSEAQQLKTDIEKSGCLNACFSPVKNDVEVFFEVALAASDSYHNDDEKYLELYAQGSVKIAALCKRLGVDNDTFEYVSK